MGVVGAAVATTFSRGVGVVYQLVLLARGRGVLVIARRHLVVRFSLMRELLRLSSTAALQVLVETASWLGLVRILASFGGAALAGYTIAMRVAIFALLRAFGMANAAATLVGQNLGAERPDRARQSVRAIGRYNVAFLGTVTLAFALVPGAIVSIFTSDAEVVALAAQCLRIVALGFVLFAYGMVAVQAFNGAGDTVTPMLLNVGCFWLFKIPLAWILSSHFGLGPRGVFLSIALAYSLQAVLADVLFRRGRWEKKKVAP
jgi:putative MATE family efflux protein